MARSRVSRRGLFSIFGRRRFERACFVVQVVINAYGDDELRRRIHEAIASGSEEETPAQKRAFYRRVCDVVAEAEPFFEQGAWTYQDDPDEADDEFAEWVAEIEAEIATDASETGTDVDGVARLDAERRYVVFTLAFVLTAPNKVAEQYDDEDEDDYTKPIFRELIESVAHLDFENVDADAVFLVPGNDQDGLSWSDLADDGWEHLHLLHSGTDALADVGD